MVCPRSRPPVTTVSVVADCVPSAVDGQVRSRVIRQSPAAAAGLKAGDVIVASTAGADDDWLELVDVVRASQARR